MAQPDLTIIPSEETPKEEVSLKGKKPTKQIEYEAEKVELSKNIQRFDKKPRVVGDDPYSFNSVSLKRKDVRLVPTAEQMIVNSTYNAVGKFLGLDTRHEWNEYHDKVFEIVEWAKKKSGVSETSKLIRWINHMKNRIPNLSDKVITNLYLSAHMQLKK